MAETRPGVVVTGLTLAAMALVAVLAVQADGTAARTAAAKPQPSPTVSAPAPSPTPTVPAVPADSGTGRRVVYSLAAHQVWLVDPARPEPVAACFPVTPGSAEPAVGSYPVYSRSVAGTGTDGRKIEHVVRFARQDGTVFGFSAAVDDPTTPPDTRTPTTRIRTGGIRASRDDATLLWEFAPGGTRVVVVP